MATTQQSNSSRKSISVSSIDQLKDKKVLSFPSDLGVTVKDSAGNDYTYVLIRINTSTNGNKLKEDKGVGDVLTAARARQSGALQIGETANLASYLPNSVYNNAKPDQDMNTRFGSENVAKEKWIYRPGLTKLDRVIVLPMPNNYNVDTTMDYSNEDTGLLSNAADAVASRGEGLMTIVGGKLASAGLNGIANALKKAAGMNTSTTGPGEDRKLFAAGRLATNSKKEILFNEISFRTFNFNYVFAPKNALESTTIQEIIRTLRYYASPELDGGKLFYTFPAEFEISLMKGNTENTALPRITTCVLENINVSYSSGSTWGNLPDGMSPEVSVLMKFKELELVDRNRIWDRESSITSGY